jgi:hypothetical protein
MPSLLIVTRFSCYFGFMNTITTPQPRRLLDPVRTAAQHRHFADSKTGVFREILLQKWLYCAAGIDAVK